ncbi:hypothetical protein R0J87_18490, partial [Halomonas sp. SIMBA_159]
MNYKYQIENSVAMRAVFHRLIQQPDLETLEIKKRVQGEKCHLYMICSRPRITINPKKLDINNERISGSFIIDKGEIKDEVP